MGMGKLAGSGKILKNGLNALGLEIRRIRPANSSGFPRASNFSEEDIIRDLLGKIPLKHRFCVDIGAGDGESMSNSFFLFRSGWEGLAAEWDGARFARLAYRYAEYPGARLSRSRITPDNVLEILASYEVPREFGFLSLDIDSYDYYVLEKILSRHRPALICTEINEKIPPPLKFTVKWAPDHRWTFDHFYGQSLSMLEALANLNEYALVGLEYNNAFLVPKEKNPLPVLTAAAAFQQGYRQKPDRLERLPWNRDMDHLLDMSPAEAAACLRDLFRKYEGRYILEP